MIPAGLGEEVEGERTDGEGEIRRWKEINLKKVLCLVLGILTNIAQYFSFRGHAWWFSGLTPGSAFRIIPDGVQEDPILL